MNDKNETPKIIRLVETDSTNNYLREQSAKARLPEGSLVIADFQTAGKGQVGNSWESEAGKNLMFSILLYPDFLPANRQFLISQIAPYVKKTVVVASASYYRTGTPRYFQYVVSNEP
jgi:BirA family biotin operon repressor/biotin-[acetyl-CoA-carboxylase] ligase